MRTDPDKPMLPDPLRVLISAYASGDLSPRRRSAAVRLLRHSAEARRLLKELKANRRRLRALARPELPADFAARLIDAIAEQAPIIRPSVTVVPSAERFSRASRFVAAIAVLAAVAIGSYLFGSLPRQPAAPNVAVTKRPPTKIGSGTQPFFGPEAVAEQAGPIESSDPAAADSAVAQLPPDRKDNSASPPVPDPLGTTTAPPPKLMKIDPPRLLALPVRELDSPEARKRLLLELRKTDVHHIDLFSKDPAKAFERLQAAIRGRNIKLVVDAVAQDTVKRKVRGQFLIYCDDLTAADWSQVLQAVAAADKKAGDNLFDHLVVLPFDGADQRELTALFGADVSQDEARRPGAGGAEPKKESRQAFAAGLFPRRTPPNSKDVRQFIDGHRDRANGDLAVVLVLRMPSN